MAASGEVRGDREDDTRGSHERFLVVDSAGGDKGHVALSFWAEYALVVLHLENFPRPVPSLFRRFVEDIVPAKILLNQKLDDFELVKDSARVDVGGIKKCVRWRLKLKYQIGFLQRAVAPIHRHGCPFAPVACRCDAPRRSRSVLGLAHTRRPTLPPLASAGGLQPCPRGLACTEAHPGRPRRSSGNLHRKQPASPLRSPPVDGAVASTHGRPPIDWARTAACVPLTVINPPQHPLSATSKYMSRDVEIRRPTLDSVSNI